MATLDKSKDYGISLGNPTHSFVQNEKLFNSEGKEVDETGKLVKQKASETVVLSQKDSKKSEADEQLSAQAKA